MGSLIQGLRDATAPFTSVHARVHIVASPAGTWERIDADRFSQIPVDPLYP
jgi:hypothetical protein